MGKIHNSYGLVVCGGKSTRMGSDKGLLAYHQIPQRYHVYDMLKKICPEVFISCREAQKETIDKEHKTLVDADAYLNIGPMAALLTAFKHYPKSNFLAIGCDYPSITIEELSRFLLFTEDASGAAAFYNEEYQLYEPMLAWYSHAVYLALLSQFERQEYSLQHFLKVISAERYLPLDINSMKSVDTPEERRTVQLQAAESIPTIL